MKKIWDVVCLIWKYTFSKFVVLLTLVWLFYGYLKEGDVIDLSKLGLTGVLTVLLSTLTIVLLDYIYKILSEGSSLNNPEHKKISDHVRERIGTSYSQQTADKRYVDNKHSFSSILRQDLLDHSTGDYFSFRRLKGTNVSSNISDGLIYCESTDYKIAFEDITIEAIDTKTGESLTVEALNNIHEKRITHAFKIHFPRPLKNNESFDIAYSIFLPKELECLDSNEEIMSISLSRIKKGLEHLSFNVCLDFKPRAVRIYKKSKLSGKLILIESQDTDIELYEPQTDLEKRFFIEWSTSPYIIKWSNSKPVNSLYVIKYIR